MGNSRIVLPRTKREVESLAATVRADLELSATGRVSMVPILEQVLYEVIPDYDFRVREDHLMGKLEGLTDEREPVIYLKESVYRALERGDGRARMTAAHELGHLLMHCGMPTYRAFSAGYEPLYDPERQANIFAAAFLMPAEAFRRCRTAREAMQKFGVSRDAATCRARNLRHNFEAERPILTVRPKVIVNKKRGPASASPPRKSLDQKRPLKRVSYPKPAIDTAQVGGFGKGSKNERPRRMGIPSTWPQLLPPGRSGCS